MSKIVQLSTAASLYDGGFGPEYGWAAPGMSYIITTSNNKLIVIDGGHEKDANNLLTELKFYSHNALPEIELWIFTHSHIDHIGAVKEISESENLRSQIKIKNFLYYFPFEYRDREKRGINYSLLLEMDERVKLFHSNKIVPKTGEKIIIDDITIHFLFVPENKEYVDLAVNENMCSVIFSVQGDSKKVIITGDAYESSLNEVFVRYGDDLRSDILQMPHHGFCDTAHLKFYQAVDAKCLLIPTSIAGDRCMRSGIYSDWKEFPQNAWAIENAKTIYKSFNGKVEIEL